MLDSPLTQLHNLFIVFEGSETVRYDQQGEVFAKSFDVLYDGLFGFVVQRAGDFVKDDDIAACLSSARAMPIRWRWLPEKRMPRSPTKVWYCLGQLSMVSEILESFQKARCPGKLLQRIIANEPSVRTDHWFERDPSRYHFQQFVPDALHKCSQP